MTWRRIWLVANRELRERIASRAFQVSTAFTLLIVIAGLVLPVTFGLGDPPEWTVGTVDAPDSFTAQAVSEAASEEGTVVEVDEYVDEPTLRRAVLGGEADIGIVDTVILNGPNSPQELLAISTALLVIPALEDAAADLGTTAEELGLLMSGSVQVENLEDEPTDDGAGAIAFIGAVLLFISILTYGQWVLIGVVEEKSSRVVEVVLGSLPARHLLAGKVIGIGLLGLAQLLLVVGIGFFGVRWLDTVDLPEITGSMVAIIVFWFILGFAFYATGFAVTGSLVSRQEEAQNASFPLTMIMTVSYFVAITALGDDENIVLRIVSLVPPFSPVTMPVRQASGSAAAWEVVVAAGLMIAATIFLLRLGGRIYSGGLLKVGGKLSLREAFRSAEE